MEKKRRKQDSQKARKLSDEYVGETAIDSDRTREKERARAREKRAQEQETDSVYEQDCMCKCACARSFILSERPRAHEEFSETTHPAHKHTT